MANGMNFASMAMMDQADDLNMEECIQMMAMMGMRPGHQVPMTPPAASTPAAPTNTPPTRAAAHSMVEDMGKLAACKMMMSNGNLAAMMMMDQADVVDIDAKECMQYMAMMGMAGTKVPAAG